MRAVRPSGTPVSVFSIGFETKDGAHNIHKNPNVDIDGALVLNPKTSDLLFAFSTQTF